VSSRPRTASPDEAASLWPAVRTERIFDAAEQFETYVTEGPWRVRANDRGDAALLGVWRRHLDVLAIRGMWCPPQRMRRFVSDAREVACGFGLDQVLSPLLPVELLGPYRREGMALHRRIVAIQGRVRDVRHDIPVPVAVSLRAGCEADLPALADLEVACFDEFWRYGSEELRELSRTERLVVAVTRAGQLIGYTLATESRGAATLGRLGVASGFRRLGVAQALVSDVVRWAADSGSETLSLCTQEENAPARALYRDLGLAEVRDVYGFAMGEAAPKEGRS
jgi:ribosomal protein S18 acetylase RimI-like enzyme